MQVRAEKISREYTRRGNLFRALQETDFLLQPGKVTVLEGRSGSGKTTLLHILAGILRPTSGSVYYDEEDLLQKSDEQLSRFRNAHCGIILQGRSMLTSLTVLENVMLPETIYGAGADAEQKALRLLEKLGIADLKDVPSAQLSGGEARRAAIARALIRDPGVIFADEPTGDLDDDNTKQVFELLRREAEAGKAVLIVTHEKNMQGFADELYTMDGGILRKE